MESVDPGPSRLQLHVGPLSVLERLLNVHAFGEWRVKMWC